MTRAEHFAPVTEAPYVAAFTPVANFAVGDETPGVSPPNCGACCRVRRRGASRGSGPGRKRSRPRAAKRIVAVVRDAHRHAWMAAALDTVLAARPDTIVVEMGVPQSPPRGALHLATHGAARVCGRAAAEVIMRLVGGRLARRFVAAGCKAAFKCSTSYT